MVMSTCAHSTYPTSGVCAALDPTQTVGLISMIKSRVHPVYPPKAGTCAVQIPYQTVG